MSYAADLALNVSSTQGSEQERVTRVRVYRGVMTHTSEVREKKTYTFRNEDSAPSTVVVEHPVRAGYELRSAAQPIETTAAWMRFRLEVPAKQTAALVVEEARPVVASYTISDINSKLVATFVQQRSIDKSVEEALRKVLAQKDAIDSVEAQEQARDAELQKIYDDQQRLRENMKALKGSPEEKALLQRYVRQLNTEETRLETVAQGNRGVRRQEGQRPSRTGPHDRGTVVRRQAVGDSHALGRCAQGVRRLLSLASIFAVDSGCLIAGAGSLRGRDAAMTGQ